MTSDLKTADKPMYRSDYGWLLLEAALEAEGGTVEIDKTDFVNAVAWYEEQLASLSAVAAYHQVAAASALASRKHYKSLAAKHRGSPETEASGVYLLVKDDKIVYVGQSKNLEKRIRTHKANYRPFDYALKIAVPLPDLDATEAMLIRQLNPEQNRNIGPAWALNREADPLEEAQQAAQEAAMLTPAAEAMEEGFRRRAFEFNPELIAISTALKNPIDQALEPLRGPYEREMRGIDWTTYAHRLRTG